MKKTLFMLSLIVGVLSLGISQAHAAVPAIDGALGVGEWANTGYPYFLEVFDPNEADNAFNNTDISHGALLQELTSFSGDADFSNDGVYLLLEVYAPPPTLDWQSVGVGGVGITSVPMITLQGDFAGDGFTDPSNLFIRHFNTNPGPGAGVDKVEVCVGAIFACLGPGGTWTDLTLAGGAFARDSVLEYFIPSGAFGTPVGVPFPGSFVGQLTYDNGLGGPNTSDDIVIGTLVPEPGTMFMALAGLLGLAGFGRKFGR
jgi:hypothetical protein